MAKHLYLPQLDASGNITEPPRVGHWALNEPKILRGISDGIVIDAQAKGRGVSSVPDVWARPLMFQSALRRNSGHPLRDRFIQEWRGLLSLLALRGLKDYHVEIVPVPLPQSRFTSALQRLAPAPVRLEPETGYQWTDVFLIKWDNIPIGGFSPATLVYTGTSYHTLLLQTQHTLKDAAGYLAPPQDEGDLRHVATWVEDLYDRLNRQEDNVGPILNVGLTEDDAKQRDVSIVGDINSLLREWRQNLRTRLSRRGETRPESSNVLVAQSLVGPEITGALAKYRVYQELLHPLVLEEGKAVRNSDFSLVLSTTRNHSGYQEIVVITKAMLERNGLIWGSKRLADLGGDASEALTTYFDHPSGTVIDRADLASKGAMWIRPELYFLTDTLVCAENGNAFLNADYRLANVETRFVLPFRKEILDVFSPREIIDRLQPQYKETDVGVVFSFRLPLVSGEAYVERLYRTKSPKKGEGTVRTTPPPIVELFPKYVDQHWRRYYLLQSNAETLGVRPIPTNRATEITTRIQEIAGTTRQVCVTQLNGDGAYPEGIAFMTVGGDPVGLLLIPKPAEPAQLSQDWRVGIDFGTSNTNVYWNLIGGDAVPWKIRFTEYLQHVTASTVEDRGVLLNDYVVPDTDIDLPIPTVLRIFEYATKDHLLLDYFIYFTSTYQLPTNVYPDIKWEDPQGLKTQYFLEALLFLILLDAALRRVNKLELAFSYPKAFSDDIAARFGDACRKTMEKLLEGDERVTSRRRVEKTVGYLGVPKQVYYLEGIAVGEYFASTKFFGEERAAKKLASVCLDIGGGTTDVSVWCDEHIVFDASFLLAGRQITELLRARRGVVEALLSKDAVMALHDCQGEPSRFAGRLNVILRCEDAAIREALVQSSSDEIRWLRRMLAIEFGAIAFYTVSLLGAAKAVAPNLARNATTRGVKLHWGGNAARFISWIDRGESGPDSPSTKILDAIIFNALKDIGIQANQAGLGQQQSLHFKSEVSGGVAVMDVDQYPGTDTPVVPSIANVVLDMDAANADVTTGVVAGERIQLTNGHTIDHTDFISERSLFQNGQTLFDTTTLDRLSRFADIMNFIGVRVGLFSEGARIDMNRYRQKIDDALRSHFLRMQGRPEGKRAIEPIFITEVKLLMDYLTQGERS